MRLGWVLALAAASFASSGSAQVDERSLAERMRDSIDTKSVAEDTPMQTRDARTRAEELLAERRSAKRGEAIVGLSKDARQALAYREALDEYAARSEPRRAQALAEVMPGAALHQEPGSLRTALEKDLKAWSDTFGFDKQTLQDQRDQWLAEKTPMSAQDWARRRAEWFAARDTWIAGQRKWAQEKIGSSP